MKVLGPGLMICNWILLVMYANCEKSHDSLPLAAKVRESSTGARHTHWGPNKGVTDTGTKSVGIYTG